jgi:ABC-type spermidine/putrescine transport system permease subunit II
MPVLSILIALALSTYAAVAGCLLSLWFYGREWRISRLLT